MELITPHGDRKRDLPAGDRADGLFLITPHGDRKPRLVESPPSRGRAHYPSWGSKTCGRALPSTAFEVSLPLMGIENGGRNCWRASQRCAHYPSWGSKTPGARPTGHRIRISLPLMGIENTRTCCAERTLHGPHYPSWGSKTAGAEPADGRLTHLITPHGDRKRWRCLAGIAVIEVSLPLMGIENQFAGVLVGVDTELITPHGDRKPVTLGALVGTSGRSLPLMGIENRAYRRRATPLPWPHYPSWGSKTWNPASGGRRAFALITPHGDRKPFACYHSCKSGETSHYPSWGSKTVRMLSFLQIGRDISLPLMGIENRSHVIIPANRERHLITPHGDRKRRRSAADGGRLDASLPLMGIENPATTPPPPTKSFSLPLMGIENAFDCRASYSSRRPLITPHGDRKRAPLPGGAAAPGGSLPLMGIENERRRTATPDGRTSSLPLMGIENGRSVLDELGLRILITPHGDRKPRLSGRTGRAT